MPLNRALPTPLPHCATLFTAVPFSVNITSGVLMGGMRGNEMP